VLRLLRGQRLRDGPSPPDDKPIIH
jgi:hypothetical protein